MRKYIVLLVFLVCTLGLVACNSNQQEQENKIDSNSQEIIDNTVTEIGRGTLKKPIELSEEDAETLAKILKNESWNTDETTDCANDCAINLKGRLVYYHSDCGTFNEYDLSDMTSFSAQESNIDGKSLLLTETEQKTVNTILKKYIMLGADNELTE